MSKKSKKIVQIYGNKTVINPTIVTLLDKTGGEEDYIVKLHATDFKAGTGEKSVYVTSYLVSAAVKTLNRLYLSGRLPGLIKHLEKNATDSINKAKNTKDEYEQKKLYGVARNWQVPPYIFDGGGYEWDKDGKKRIVYRKMTISYKDGNYRPYQVSIMNCDGMKSGKTGGILPVAKAKRNSVLVAMTEFELGEFIGETADVIHSLEEQKNRKKYTTGFFTKLRGVSFQEQKLLLSLKVKEYLKLIRERDLVVDDITYPNAIRVETGDGKKVGYIADSLAEKIAPVIDNGGGYECQVSEITGLDENGKPREGINVGVNVYLKRVFGKTGSVVEETQNTGDDNRSEDNNTEEDVENQTETAEDKNKEDKNTKKNEQEKINKRKNYLQKAGKIFGQIRRSRKLSEEDTQKRWQEIIAPCKSSEDIPLEMWADILKKLENLRDEILGGNGRTNGDKGEKKDNNNEKTGTDGNGGFKW